MTSTNRSILRVAALASLVTVLLPAARARQPSAADVGMVYSPFD